MGKHIKIQVLITQRLKLLYLAVAKRCFQARISKTAHRTYFGQAAKVAF